jgi:magnesium-transporting ATPase (P-type)
MKEQNIIIKKLEEEKIELKEIISKEGDELRKSLLDKLFNLNTILSAAFLVLYQFDKSSFNIKILNVLPFCTILLILLYQLCELKMLGFVYHKIDTWKKNDDLKTLENNRIMNFNIIVFSIILTVIEIIYLFNILLNLNVLN